MNELSYGLIKMLLNIIYEYLDNMINSEFFAKLENNVFLLSLGFRMMIHIFQLNYIHSKNINDIYFNCQKAYYYYLEYLEQMHSTNMCQELNHLDALLFVYSKTLIKYDNNSINDSHTPNTPSHCMQSSGQGAKRVPSCIADPTLLCHYEVQCEEEFGETTTELSPCNVGDSNAMPQCTQRSTEQWCNKLLAHNNRSNSSEVTNESSTRPKTNNLQENNIFIKKMSKITKLLNTLFWWENSFTPLLCIKSFPDKSLFFEILMKHYNNETDELQIALEEKQKIKISYNDYIEFLQNFC